MKAWKKVAVPHEDVLTGSLTMSEFAADLNLVAKGRASSEYQDARQFFERTYITEGMKELLVSVARRLKGLGGDPVVQLKTNFGGGKTHSMLAVYHMARRGDVPASGLKGVPQILDAAGIDGIPESRTAVLVGTAISPNEPEGAGGRKINTLWGRLAFQLLGLDGYEMVERSDVEGTPPGSDLLAEILRRAAPCVVFFDEMVKFILSDLDKAEMYLKNFTPSNKRVPSLAVAYGIRAKVHLWDEDYANAAKYARLAIETSGATPMTEDEWENPNTGFASAANSWMWYLTYSPESMGNLCNYCGWASAEADWGYSSLTCPMIDRSLYDKIASTDFRKHVFVNPKKFDYYNYETSRDRAFIEDAPDYLALKFRCKFGDWQDYSNGGATDVPIMRVEEMYLIEAEAVAASQGVEAGVALLNSFMQKYRQPNYKCTITDLREFQLEVLTQMRIEFWGEGNAFPSAKRLKPGVIQNYEGTNAPADIFKINCEGIKPLWNLVIPVNEEQSNVALVGKNNPDPTQCVKGPSPVGEYAKSKAELEAEKEQ